MVAPLKTREFVWLFAMIVAVDVALIVTYAVLQMVQSFDRIESFPPLLNITLDRSLGEFYTYIKWLSCSIILSKIYGSSRITAYAQMASLFFFLLLDDSLQIHERAGRYFSDNSPVEGLLGSGVGELIFWAFVGSLLLVLVMTGIRSTPRGHWGRIVGVILLLGLTAAFGVGADFLRVLVMLTEGDTLKNMAVHAFGILEDGGEMIGASACCAYVFAMLRHPVPFVRAPHGLTPRSGRAVRSSAGARGGRAR
jgi:hypothetical protein